MIIIKIEQLSEGYVVENGEERFAVNEDRMIQKIKSLFGITSLKKKEADNSVPQPSPELHDIKDRIESRESKKPLKAGKLHGLGKTAISRQDPDSVPKAPEISAPREDRKEKCPDEDWLKVEKFDWSRENEKAFKNIFFYEQDDGHVMLSYFSGRYFTSIENVLKIPFPVPRNYLNFIKSSNHKQAVVTYREYLHIRTQKESGSGSVRVPDSGPVPMGDRKEKEDPDRAFKPMLKGAFSTRADYDGSKIEGALL